jgi:hypothetical protein
LIVALTADASVDFLPYWDSIAPLIGERSFSTEPVFFENAVCQESTACLKFSRWLLSLALVAMIELISSVIADTLSC